MFCMLKTLGDVLIGTTLVRELKKDYPDSEIHVFTNKMYGELFSNNPEVFEIHAPDDWNPNLLFMQMASGEYDKVFCPIQQRRECNAWHQIEETRHQNLLDFYWMRMGRHRPITERECYLFPTDADFLKASEHITLDVPRVAIHTTSGVESKDWPYFDRLVEELRVAGYGVVQVGGRDDKKVKGAVDLCGKMTFLELAAFLSQTAAFVGLDSGVSYIADAMKTPTIVIQGSTNPLTSGPISNRVIHLFAKETGYADCQVIRCHANCRHEVNCNTKISVQDVLSKLEPILETWKKPIPTGV
jgi:ADP-heptose:LPS heptosyltransferase